MTVNQQKFLRGGLTLVELVVSLAVFSVLMLAMGSVLIVSAKGMDSVAQDSSSTADLQRIANQMAAEIAEAKTVTANTPALITFTVNDRNADGFDETITYQWLGTPTTPGALTRTLNTGTSETLADNLTNVSLSYQTVVVPPSGPTESAELLLAGWTTSATPKQDVIKNNLFLGARVVPTLPPEALSWRITRVRYRAGPDGPSNGRTQVRIRTIGADGLPTSTILEQKRVYESTLPGTIGWTEVSFTSAMNLAPTDRAAIAFEYESGNVSMEVEYEENSTSPDLTLLESDSQDWQIEPDAVPLIEVFGRAELPATGSGAGGNQLKSVNISLTAVATAARARAGLLNQVFVP